MLDFYLSKYDNNFTQGLSFWTQDSDYDVLHGNPVSNLTKYDTCFKGKRFSTDLTLTNGKHCHKDTMFFERHHYHLTFSIMTNLLKQTTRKSFCIVIKKKNFSFEFSLWLLLYRNNARNFVIMFMMAAKFVPQIPCDDSSR